MVYARGTKKFQPWWNVVAATALSSCRAGDKGLIIQGKIRPRARNHFERQDLERIMKDLKAQGTRTMPAGSSPAGGDPPGNNPPGSSNPARPTGLTTEIQARI